ncbi:TRAP transporter large permease [uncultured Dysosmobacter sp.]|uniref:TRAP transporter large permease n=1 Tax=uncultured Dysosmobacter sp. TaxID=2591384 RepID=UPI002607DFF4|nr:TRAP transporter large permease [uncultured Dysosmobacter sp.]
MEILISVIVILALMFLGCRVFASFLVGSLVYIFMTGTGQATVGPLVLNAISSSSLLAVPLYMLAGGLMEVSGIAGDLVDFANHLLKKVKYGVGATIPLACMFFGAICGSGLATVSALGNIMVPKLEKLGYDRRYVAAMLTAACPLGYMIPPNMNAIIFGVVANVSIAGLFSATIIPGIIWGVLLIVLNRFMAPKWVTEVTSEDAMKYGAEAESYWGGLRSSFFRAFPAILLAVIILGGIYGGIFTPTEAGAVGCLYAILTGLFYYKKLKRKETFQEFIKAGKSLGSIFIIFPMVALFSRFLILKNVPQIVVTLFTSVSENPYVILLLLGIMLLIAGMFFDANILMLVLTPMIMPTCNYIGLDPLQLGVIMMVAVGIGASTPPMAMHLFVACRVANTDINETVKPLIPMLLLACLPIMLLVMYVPVLSLWLPGLLMG